MTRLYDSGSRRVLIDRFSPTHFDRSRSIRSDDVDLLLDAARRAPSAGNSQPWSFIVGVRGDEIHTRLARHLAGSSRGWATAASLLLANLALEHRGDSSLPYSEFAQYDLGQALAHLTFQAHAVGLHVHQFRAFNRDSLAIEFGVPSGWCIATMAAVGTAIGTADTDIGPGTNRHRKSLEQITWARADQESMGE
jgi:nitroreductase